MDRSQLLGTTFDCTCGKTHHVPTKYLFYGENIIETLAERVRALSTARQYLVVADSRTWLAAGQKVFKKLMAAGAGVQHFIVPDANGETPAADDTTKDFILANAPDCDLYIAVGSGVINDLVKWAAFLKNKPYIAVPTAASMNGYASANVAATVDGLKVLFHAKACLAVFADANIINSAPRELTTSGLGDVLAKSVSSADWKLNQFLFGDYYCQYSVDLLKDLEPIYLDNPDNIKRNEPAALKALFEALFFSSIAMTMTGTSSPASGGEHLISHTLDMLATRDNRKHDLHGRQVGVGSILTAALYEQVMAIDTPVFQRVPQQINSSFWGSLSAIVEKEYLAKKARLEQAALFLGEQENWQGLKKRIQPGLVPAAKLKDCLAKAGGAHRFFDLREDGNSLTREGFIDIVKHANQMRQRFTILDLAALLGILPGQIENLVDAWTT